MPSGKTRNIEEIKEIVESYGYVLLEEYIMKAGKARRIVIKDSNGYKYNTTLTSLIKNKGNTKFVDPKNPFSLYNISAWIKINNKDFDLCENNVYTGKEDYLYFYCHNCKETFTSVWNNIRSGQGCGKCRGLQIGQYNNLEYLRPDLTEEWHPTLNGGTTPSLVTKGYDKKVYWICKRCNYGANGEWFCEVYHRYRGVGCPSCKMSGGEKRISFWLNKNNIKYILQCCFEDLKSKKGKLLRYDFGILSGKNIVYLIEFDDIQHEEFNSFFHKTEEKFLDHKERDKIKNSYAKKKGIPLLRIKSSNFVNIEKILEQTLL